jgi:non-heme chloroperoxidase
VHDRPDTFAATPPDLQGGPMATITVGRENSSDIDIYYEDQGSGPAVVLMHGWPFDGRSWEPQLHPLLAAGYRVINYDRRGFGRSSRPSAGYDFDTLAADLGTVLSELDLRDVTLIGFSLGTGELARYIGRYGTDRLRSVVFIETLAPSFTKSADNPKGIDEAGVADVQKAILDDRYAWLTGLIGDFLNLDEYLGKRSARRRPALSGTRASRRPRMRPGRACSAGSTTSAPTSSGSTYRP